MHGCQRDRLAAGCALLIALLSLQSLPAFQAGNPEYLKRDRLTGRRGGNLVVAINSDPASFNRMLTASLAHATVTDRISADLVHINRATAELEPALAKSWDVSPDGCVYMLQLRRGLRFSDGSPFSADDVLFTFQVLADPKTSAFMAGQVRVDGSFPRISKIDDYSIRLAYDRPVGMGLRSLDSVPILPRNRLLQAYVKGNLGPSWGPNAPPGEISGMGPFRLREYRRGERIVLERNPHFWITDSTGQALPYLDTITFLVVPDRNTESLRFQAGEIQVMSSLSPEAYGAILRGREGSRLILRDLGPGLAMDFLWFNLNPVEKRASKTGADAEKLEIFSKAEFRQAISLAIDRAGIVKSVFLGLAAPQAGPISSGNAAWHDRGLRQIPHDPARAKGLLQRIGLKDGDGDGIIEFGKGRRPLEITLLTARGSAAREKTAQIIRDNLLRIGIRAEIQLLLPNELAAHFIGTLDYEAVLFGLTPTDVAPDLQTDLWYSSGKNHFWAPGQAHPQTPWESEIDGLVARLVRSLNPGERRGAFDRVQAIWAREMPAIPIVAPNILAGWARGVGNLKPSVLPPHLLWNAEELTVPPR